MVTVRPSGVLNIGGQQLPVIHNGSVARQSPKQVPEIALAAGTTCKFVACRAARYLVQEPGQG